MSPARRRRETEYEAALRVARGLPTEYLICRVFQHAWDQGLPLGAWDGVLGLWRLTIVCSRCTTEKDAFMNRQGYLAGRGRPPYRYPEDYQVTELPLTSRVGRAACRAVLMERLGLQGPR